MIRDGDGKVLVVRQRASGKWGIPKGALKVGERLTDAIVREVREETGLNVDVSEAAWMAISPRLIVASLQPNPTIHESRVVIDPDEISEYKFVPESELAGMSSNGNESLRLLIDSRKQVFANFEELNKAL